jgi:tetratricopeptide (TPR) repeat protein
MWIGIGVVSLLCCLFALAVVRNNRATPPREPTIASARTDLPSTPLPILPQPNEASPQPPGTLQPLNDASPEVTAARELVNNNPGDPFAHLQLSLALWDSGQVRPAMEEFAQASNLAGPDNKDFFLKAADEFKSREAWIATAGAYLRLVPMYRESSLPEDIETDFHEAVYKASEKKEMPLFVFFERIDNASLPLGFIARGRYALYNGTLEDANTQLKNAQNIKPDMYENYLLKAEIESKSGNKDEAKKILRSLSSDLGAPEWIRFMAENYFKSLQ